VKQHCQLNSDQLLLLIAQELSPNKEILSVVWSLISLLLFPCQKTPLSHIMCATLPLVTWESFQSLNQLLRYCRACTNQSFFPLQGPQNTTVVMPSVWVWQIETVKAISLNEKANVLYLIRKLIYCILFKWKLYTYIYICILKLSRSIVGIHLLSMRLFRSKKKS
jgi:hypothetical protein